MDGRLPFWFLLPLLSYSLASEESQLLNDLFEDYNKNSRPVRSISDIVEVRLKLTLTNLISLNEKEETMTTNVWLQLEWDDYRLTWNESDYAGISVLRVSPDMVWLPDIVLENNVDGQFEVAYYANVLVYSTGYISWLPPAIFRSACAVEVTYFPFDWQNCTLVFRSKTYTAKEITLLLAFAESGDLLERVDIDPEAFTENGEWAIKHCPAWKYVNNRYTEEDLQYQEINFGLVIQRKPLFYIVNIIVPCVLISSLVVLVYFLPAKAGGQKCTVSISVLLAQTVFLFLIAQKVPETSLNVPLIGKYLIFVMIVSTIIVLSCVIVLNVSLRTPSTHNLTAVMKRRLLEVLPRYLHMKIEPCEEEEQTPKERRKSSLGIMLKAEEYVLKKPRSELMFERQRERHGLSRDSRGHRVDGFDVGVTTPLFRNLAHIAPEIKECVEACNFITSSTKDQNKTSAEMENWIMIGKVIDVLCFWGALPLFVVGTFAIFITGHLNSAPEHPFKGGGRQFPLCTTSS
ncbi:PREDICTED: acetylcholine receptor subunit epsilon-like [Nanorana parkeri]|uniref:acetylcholine receptor subunit epsilon-like n=1 Tax=Nanorana parkeri TaxID=125878 RepID=UPI000854FA4E|nr:PREDICTED: acetylcholine receptor subunit epsilon-like [Nanorana parkeri]